MRISAIWKGLEYNFVNIYAPCCVVKKRKLWRDLIKVRRGSIRGD